MVPETIAAVVEDGKVTDRELVLVFAVIATALYINSGK